MIGHVYLIRNLINGKGYIGKTHVPVAQRFLRHKQAARSGSKCLLHKAIMKYGESSFSIIALASCPVSLLSDLEEHYIKFCGTHSSEGFGYNMTYGGEGSVGCKASPETKAKMAAAKLGKKRKPFSQDHKAKMAAAKLGNVNGRGRKGQKHSNESRSKISESRKISNAKRKLK
jgi:group I intron endonuclease